MSRVLVDLETLGVTADSAILAIGAVAFEGDVVLGTFYETATLASNLKLGRKVDGDTVMWWVKQEDNVRLPLTPAWRDIQADIQAVVEAFDQWLNEHNAEEIWGNGAGFDNAFLMHVYAQVGKQWPFWKDRCYRTLKADSTVPKPETRGATLHLALDDAVRQMHHLIAIEGQQETV